jgi:hypothetical protein
MGLMYPFPVGSDETDFVSHGQDKLVLKTYGLPYIFWIYAFCSTAVVFFMFLAIKAPVMKLVEVGDQTDATLGYGLLTFIGLLPLGIFSFFFYEKRLIAAKGTMRIEHRLFAIPFWGQTIQLDPSDTFIVEAFLDSPNVARLKAQPDEQGFQNKGYFVLKLKSAKGKEIFIDRHSRKVDLEKLKALLVDVV